MTTDLLALTATLVDIDSESFAEDRIASWLIDRLEVCEHLQVDRIGDNVVARTDLGRARRVVLGGHSDTVPANGNRGARVEGDRLYGLGACDMKGGLAVMVDLAESITTPSVDATYVIYAREEVALEHNGLRELFEQRPDLLIGDFAILGEPTGGAIEAGCQGTMRLRLDLAGERAHTARAWMGTNAIHRAGAVLSALDGYVPREPTIEGCRYHEALLAVDVHGGVAGNVVPDEASLVINHRFAPDRDVAEAEAHVREFLAPFLAERDRVTLVEAAPSAMPGTDHPLLAAMAADAGLEVRAKLGWTDVAFFSEHGVPAINFGPGDPILAHTRDEYVERDALERCRSALAGLLTR